MDVPESWSLPRREGFAAFASGRETASAGWDVLVNMTPSERSFGPAASLRRNMAELLPTLKVLSGLNAKIHGPPVSVLDLTHQRIAFEALNATNPDWCTAQPGANRATTRVSIDAKSLAAQRSMREYFADEVVRHAGESGPARWLIIMSGSLFFGRQEETPLPELSPDPGRHIIYFRFSPGPIPGFRPNSPPPPPATSVDIAPAERIHGPLPGRDTVLPPNRGRGGPGGMFPDDLERLLKPMGARVISISTPEQFRKALASLIEEMSAN